MEEQANDGNGGAYIKETVEEETTIEMEAYVPVVVRIKPALSDDDVASLDRVLPEDMEDSTIKDVIDYVVTIDDLTLSEERIKDRIEAEMSAEKWGIDVNSQTVEGNEPITGYFVDKESPKGKPYRELNITVAKIQKGGSVYLVGE